MWLQHSFEETNLLCTNLFHSIDSKKIIDLFVDPPSSANFYPPNTFVEAKIERRISKRGGYFVKLPNGHQGFLKSKIDYKEGAVAVLLSKVFFDEDKPQAFTDKLKIISKYFILKFGENGFSFSRKLLKDFNKDMLIPILEEKIQDHDNIFIVCRSSVAEISVKNFNNKLEKIFQHYKAIKKELVKKKKFCDGLAKRNALEKYKFKKDYIFEEEGIFERLGLWDKIDDFLQRKFLFANGSYLILEQTSSFFAIDVNSGKDLGIGAKELNFLACREICWLIKVLGLGGKILIDFLPCSKPDKRAIYDLMVGSFFDDTPKNKIWGWTNGGFFELERERDKIPLKLLALG